MTPLATRINAVVYSCLYQQGELDTPGVTPDDAILVKGIVKDFAFHPQRVASYKDVIAGFCNEVGEGFQKSKGGGQTFLNLCMTRVGSQWGEHADCEALVVLAIATGQGGYCLPRDMWNVFPGGMPYIWFDTEK